MDKEVLDKLSDQHLNAYSAKLGDQMRALTKELSECKDIYCKVLCVQKEREVKKFSDKQMSLI